MNELYNHIALKRFMKNSYMYGQKLIDNSEITICSVSCLDDFLDSMRLLHDSYLKNGLINRQQGDLIFTQQFFSSGNKLFTVKSDRKKIGTIAIFKKEKNKIPAENVFPDLIKKNSIYNLKSAEIGSLSICQEFRLTSVLKKMYLATMLYAVAKYGVEHFYIQVDEHKRKFYQDILLFQQVGECRSHPSYKQRQAALLQVNFRDNLPLLQDLLKSQYGCTLPIRKLLDNFDLYGIWKELRKTEPDDTNSFWNKESINIYCNKCGVKANELTIFKSGY